MPNYISDRGMPAVAENCMQPPVHEMDLINRAHSLIDDLNTTLNNLRDRRSTLTTELEAVEKRARDISAYGIEVPPPGGFVKSCR